MAPIACLFLVAGLTAALTGQAIAQQGLQFPSLTGRVVDQAELLSPQAEARLSAQLEALEQSTGDQLVVVTLSSLQGHEIEDYGYQLGRSWGIGKGVNDSGALLIIAPVERKVRLEVGYGLEPVLTDAMSASIIQNSILPPFRSGDFERGILDGTDAIVALMLLDPAEAAQRAAALEPEPVDLPIGPILLMLAIFGLFAVGLIRSARRGGRRQKGDLASVLLWTAAEMMLDGHDRKRGSWSRSSRSLPGRRSSSSGSRGASFRGGGGSFGGGGASGGW